MPSNSTGQLAIWRDVANAVAFPLSLTDEGVRVRQVRAPSTTIALPPSLPNDGDAYTVLDADGSAAVGNAIVVTPPEGTTIRGGASFIITTAFASAVVTFDSAANDWTVEESTTAAPAPGSAVMTTADFVQPAVASPVDVSVSSTAGYIDGMGIAVAGGGYYAIEAIGGPTDVTLTNLGDPANLTPGDTISSGAIVTEGVGVANLLAIIGALQAQVTTIAENQATDEANIAALQGDVTTIQENQATDEANIATLQGDVTTIQENQATDEANIAALQTLTGELSTGSGLQPAHARRRDGQHFHARRRAHDRRFFDLRRKKGPCPRTTPDKSRSGRTSTRKTRLRSRRKTWASASARSPSAGITVELPPGPPNDGDMYTVLDADGSASSGNPIVVLPSAGTLIRGAASLVLAAAFAAAILVFDSEADEWTAFLSNIPRGPRQASLGASAMSSSAPDRRPPAITSRRGPRFDRRSRREP